MAELGRFFSRAGQRVAESVGGAKHTVDSDYESRKGEYKKFAEHFAQLWKRLDVYFKAVKEDSTAWQRVSEGSMACYTQGTEVTTVLEEMNKRVSEAVLAYEAAWAHVKDMIVRYDALIKHMGRKLAERDNARIDFDRLRSKWEKSGGDPVAEATARASERVFFETHATVSDNLDWFLAQRHEQVNAS